jgi:hypothetical protein
MEIQISHLPMDADAPNLLLLPVGAYYNKSLNVAKPGDVIVFWTGEKHVITHIGKMPLVSPIAGFLAKYIYNTNVSIMKEHWIAEALRNGASKKAIRTDYCIILAYDKEKYYQRD